VRVPPRRATAFGHDRRGNLIPCCVPLRDSAPRNASDDGGQREGNRRRPRSQPASWTLRPSQPPLAGLDKLKRHERAPRCRSRVRQWNLACLAQLVVHRLDNRRDCRSHLEQSPQATTAARLSPPQVHASSGPLARPFRLTLYCRLHDAEATQIAAQGLTTRPLDASGRLSLARLRRA
jgi:hypothetical protein